MYINFPRHNLDQLKALLEAEHSRTSRVSNLPHETQMRALRDLESEVVKTLGPLFDDEYAFYEQLSDILKRSILGETLSDSARHLFSTEHPFPQSVEGDEKEREDADNFTMDNDEISGCDS